MSSVCETLARGLETFAKSLELVLEIFSQGLGSVLVSKERSGP